MGQVLAAGGAQSGIMRRKKSSNIGTVNAVSPYCGDAARWLESGAERDEKGDHHEIGQNPVQ
jgi:hypothetical protein